MLPTRASQCVSGNMRFSVNDGTDTQMMLTPSGSAFVGLILNGPSGSYAGLSLTAFGQTVNSTDFELYQSGSTAYVYNTGGALSLYSSGGIGMVVAATTGVVTFGAQPTFPGGTTGAHTATFTATNKPGTATTAPSTWLPVTVAGATHYIPCWL